MKASTKKLLEQIVEDMNLLKKHVNLFSEIRGIAEAIVITKMCLADDYEEYLGRHGRYDQSS